MALLSVSVSCPAPAQPIGAEPASPLGERVAQAAAEGYRRKEKGPTPYHGYSYRMLEDQGKSDASGALD